MNHFREMNFKKVTMKIKPRCKWVGADPLYIEYHDIEWGTPLHSDQKLFEFLILEVNLVGYFFGKILSFCDQSIETLEFTLLNES